MAICPVGAIYKTETSQGDFLVLVNQEKCTECQQCVEACPFDAIWVDPVSGKAIKCDLCNGDPQCVKYCNFDAIQYAPLSAE